MNVHTQQNTGDHCKVIYGHTIKHRNGQVFAHYDTERWHVIPITYRGLLVDLCTMLDENSSCSYFTSLTSIQERCGSVLYNENTKYTQ